MRARRRRYQRTMSDLAVARSPQHRELYQKFRPVFAALANAGQNHGRAFAANKRPAGRAVSPCGSRGLSPQNRNRIVLRSGTSCWGLWFDDFPMAAFVGTDTTNDSSDLQATNGLVDTITSDA